MITTVARWGNSHAIRISKSILKQANLSLHDTLSIDVNNDTITLKKVPNSKAARFMELFGDYEGDWRCTEVDTGEPVGKEVIK